MVHAIRVHQAGGPEVLGWEDVEVGEPGPGEVRIRQHAVGLNYIDVYHRTGLYPQQTPFTPGVEGAGTVEALGPGVTALSVGDRVAYAGPIGSYSEERLIDADRLVRLPDEISFDQAAAMMLQGMTVRMLLRAVHHVEAGETILVHAAAGGVGLIMCQWAKHLGATVIGTVSTDEKATLARQNGCDHAILYTREDVAARVQEITGGKGLPVVFDGVGGPTIEASLKCLRRRGTCVSYGTAGGLIPPFDLFRLNRMGSLYFTSAGLADYIAERPEMLRRAEDLFGVMQSGAVKVKVTARYALADAAQAQQDLAARKTVGSVILVP